MEKVIVELRVPDGLSDAALMADIGSKLPGLQIDPGYPPVEVTPSDPAQVRGAAGGGKVVVIRGQIASGDKPALEAAPGVLGVWSDGPVAPFAPDADDR